ncbi:MAG: ATP-grasp domain-containing protein [Gammaproteobacteria bacterium]|nr:MAG: ATP-grasp domain-containing protein [Gammaproteobacteria bacterium]
MNARPRVLLIAPHESYRIGAYLSAAEKMHIDVLVASQGEYSLVTACADGLHIDLTAPAAALSLIKQAASQQAFDAILGTDDATVALASKAAQMLGLRHNSPAAAEISRRKDKARQCLKVAGIQIPDFWQLDLESDITAQLEAQVDPIKYPCVLKPLALSASRGVIRANNREELLTAAKRILPVITYADDAEERSQVLVETYIPGREYAVEAILYDGELDILAIFDKPEPLEGPFFEETYYITPTQLSTDRQQQLRQCISDACSAYGLHHGPVHAELRIDDQTDPGIWLLEVAARTIGGECARLMRFSTGYCLEELVLAEATGQRLPRQPLEQAVGVLMLPITQRGILRRIEGVTAAQRVNYIEQVLISFNEGYELVPLPEGASYLGFIFARGPTASAVEKALREANACLRVVTAPLLDIVDQRG